MAALRRVIYGVSWLKVVREGKLCLHMESYLRKKDFHHPVAEGHHLPGLEGLTSISTLDISGLGLLLTDSGMSLAGLKRQRRQTQQCLKLSSGYQKTHTNHLQPSMRFK
ncbi:hypothetical protein FDI66_gp55 [Aeromonas phage pIS4-A]|uniref:Uncharacterized protein n=1 Tax=Aeromonas phage pIS4-A TaxID=754050 RepID=R9TPT5_9CAUD|nr:hypothetical protein FDI66_gp55 [Aeromonas phage pIS4-A]AGN34125.1 hypothetical protein AEPG_00078 [Aeromonas phage pIS4-A]